MNTHESRGVGTKSGRGIYSRAFLLLAVLLVAACAAPEAGQGGENRNPAYIFPITVNVNGSTYRAQDSGVTASSEGTSAPTSEQSADARGEGKLALGDKAIEAVEKIASPAAAAVEAVTPEPAPLPEPAPDGE